MSSDERPTAPEVLHGAFLQWKAGDIPRNRTLTFGDFAAEALDAEDYVILDKSERLPPRPLQVP